MTRTRKLSVGNGGTTSNGVASSTPSVATVTGAILGLIQAAPLILVFMHSFPATTDDHVTLFFVAVPILAATGYMFYHVLSRVMKLRSVMGLVFTAVTFTAYLDTFIALCLMSPKFYLGRFYLDKGEKYFTSTYGFICLFWDGTFHVVIQLALAVLALTKREYHFVALIWSGSIINSMAPLLFGATIGPYSGEIQLATALNTPYVFFPFAIVIYLLSKTPAHKKEGPGHRVRSHHLLADIVLLTYNFVVPMIHIVRVLCVLGSRAKVVEWWVRVEPILDRKTVIDKNDMQDFAFMSIQVIQWAFWFVPWHWAALFEQIERIRTGKRTVLLGTYGVDFAAIALGGYLQSLACHIVTSYFDMTDGSVGVHKRDLTLPQEFWLINISTLICAVLHFVHFHVQDVEEVKGTTKLH